MAYFPTPKRLKAEALTGARDTIIKFLKANEISEEIIQAVDKMSGEELEELVKGLKDL